MSKPIPRPEDFYNDYGDGLAPTIANLDAVVIIDNGEPLVDVSDLRFPGVKRNDILVRQGVAERLHRVSENLAGKGIRFIVLAGWQPKVYGHAIHCISKSALRLFKPTWAPETIREAAHQFSSAIDTFAPPAITTGGALRIFGDHRGETMEDLQNALRLIVPSFGIRKQGVVPGDFQEMRAMEAAGFIRDPWDPFCWCYGTSAWALAKGEPCAIYGRVEKATS